MIKNIIWCLSILFETALIKASVNKQTEIAKLLLEQKGIDVNARNRNFLSALLASTKTKSTEISKMLLSFEGIIYNIQDVLTFYAKMLLLI